MAYFHLERHVPLPAAEAWRRATDFARHADGIPATRIVRSGDIAAVGGRFTARTGWRRVGFDDPMEIVRWQPPGDGGTPGRCRLEKRGRLVRGWAEIEVYGEGAGTRVGWREELRPLGMPRVFDPLLARAARAVFGRALDRLLRG
ncbi:SRPBCC family protein [Streptomyces sp. A7024]|uniref:SRPBCC family protein n=1 Tax=Streptomyces coryli TaxID=1128680 RepID=A0A6G4TYM1_9ACTN|nr:SRPBCC family protein [Streptomyces coryli]NGN64546.1 SRPBCC family protein [Streptomyces coryli]